jgi:nucleotide-binding universal stress UspA family protein
MKTATATAETASGFANILFATDFSSAAAHAIPYVKGIAKHYDANLVAFHLRPPAVNIMTEPSSWPKDIEAAKAEDEGHRHELLSAFAGIRTNVQIEEGGELHWRLQAAIKKNNTDLVVLGTRGRTGIGKVLLGSVAEEILRNVKCPVLTVGPRSNASPTVSCEFREILYATDLTSASPAAAAYAVSLAQEFQSSLVLLHVIPEQKAGDLVSASDVTTAAQELLRKMVPENAQAWCKPEYFVERGNPADTILEFARQRESDLIVLGVKEETGVPGAATHLPIATAHKVVSRAICPVLTIRS